MIKRLSWCSVLILNELQCQLWRYSKIEPWIKVYTRIQHNFKLNPIDKHLGLQIGLYSEPILSLLNNELNSILIQVH